MFGFIGNNGGPGPTPGGPTIMPPLLSGWGRYFFIDGDNGDDANDGFIDAPLGSTFTPLQSAAHAVKTTNRLEAVTPMLGNGQAAIRLWMPRAGRAPYDKAAPGDGLGRCDRRNLSGYSIFIDRGSDHTNSVQAPGVVGDRFQLGCVTALGPYLVAGVSDYALTLAGAVLPPPLILAQTRLQVALAGGGWSNAAVRWGDMSGAAATDVVTAWDGAGFSANPGDSAVLQIPGVVLADFYDFEQVRFLDFDSSACGYEAAGFEVANECQLGNPAGLPSRFTMFNASAATSLVGAIVADAIFIDETGAETTSNPGLNTIGGLDSYPDVESVELHYSAALVRSVFESESLTLDRCNLENAQVQDGARFVQVGNCQQSGLALKQLGHAEVFALAQMPGGDPLDLNPGDQQFSFKPDDARPSYSLQDLFALDGVATATPSVVAHAGEYVVTWRPGARDVGTGFRVMLTANDIKSIDVTYASLLLTGFEIIGGQKVVVKVPSTAPVVALGQVSVNNANTFTDGDFFVIPTGTGPATIKVAFQVTGGYVPPIGTDYTIDLRPILPGGTFDDVLALLDGVIIAHTTLGLPSGGGGHQNLSWPTAGAAGNQPISCFSADASATAVAGFSGGVDGASPYTSGILPCPRAMPAKYAPGESDVERPVGQVVSVQESETVALAIASTVIFPVPVAAAFSVTNSHVPADGSGGYVLVSTDTTGGVIALEGGSPYPDLGAPLYVSAASPGTVTSVPPKRGAGGQDVGPVAVGCASPLNYDDAHAAPTIFVAWMPGDQAAQLAQVTTGFDVASSAALVDVPELYSYAFPKHAYRLKACVFVTAGAVGGSRVAVAGAFALDVCNFSYTFVGINPGPALVQAVTLAAFGDVAGVVKENAGNGYWLIEGSFTPAAGGGVVSVQFAQATSDVGTSTAKQGSYLEITEQK